MLASRNLILVIISFVLAPIFLRAQNLSLPSQYVQQDQHNAHLLFGVSRQVLGTYCNLSWAPNDQRCYLEFEDEDGVRSNIFLKYERFDQNQARLVARLQDLSKRWKKKYPLDFWGRSILHPFRESNHEALDTLISGIEKEGLSHRVLMLNNVDSRPTAYFYDDELVRAIFHIFIETFSRYDLREGLWGPAEVATYGQSLSDL